MIVRAQATVNNATTAMIVATSFAAMDDRTNAVVLIGILLWRSWDTCVIDGTHRRGVRVFPDSRRRFRVPLSPDGARDSSGRARVPHVAGRGLRRLRSELELRDELRELVGGARELLHRR